jgi:hypothetical protein
VSDLITSALAHPKQACDRSIESAGSAQVLTLAMKHCPSRATSMAAPYHAEYDDLHMCRESSLTAAVYAIPVYGQTIGRSQYFEKAAVPSQRPF